MESQRRRRVLVVDDDHAVQVSLALLLKQAGFDAACADGPREALAQLDAGMFDLVLQDMNFSLQTSGEEGIELLERIKAAYPALPVLLMTAWGSIALAVRGVKAGAANFFTKPWDNAQLVDLIEATLDLGTPPAAASRTRAALDAKYDFTGIVGEHPKLLKVLETIAQVAATRAPVLVLGESGTGKELIADAIHRNSPRSDAPIVKINMGAITTSLFESEMFGHVRGAFTDARDNRKGHIASADGGTPFLDEVGEMTLRMQGLLLRFLETGELQKVGADRVRATVNIRVNAATNKNLRDLIAQQAFREDLFYRLNVIHLVVPPLRERRSDIPKLVERFLARSSATGHYALRGVSAEAMDALTKYSWPGNVRELQNLVERLAVTCQRETALPEDLPPEIRLLPFGTYKPRRERRRTVSDELYQRLVDSGESFWTAVYPLYMQREITRGNLRDLVKKGLQEARGNYRIVVRLFNMEPGDYKRFLNFLRTHECQVSFKEFR
jgi:DNA-binding NtrC family response regulator